MIKTMIEQTITVENISVEIFYDQFADSPREWDNSTKFVMFHNRYNLPNEIGIDHNDYSSWSEMQEALEKDYKNVHKVYMYDHSGVALSLSSFGDRWDSGQVGFIVTDNKSPEASLVDAMQELESYSHWLNGETFGVSVFEDTELVDTNLGYYGYDHEKSGLTQDLQDTLIRNTNLSITQQILNQIS